MAKENGKQDHETKVKPLGAGKHHLKVRFIPADPINFYSCDASVVWEVQKGRPVLESWDMKEDCVIVYGQAIDTQNTSMLGWTYTGYVNMTIAQWQVQSCLWVDII